MAVTTTQLAGAGDGFGAALHLQLVEDPAVVPFDGVQGEEEPLADLPVREALGDQLQDFQFAWAQRLDKVLRLNVEG
jgi:hypothetical protein